MKKIICIICVFSLCVPFLLVPSSAEDMNYLDYITEITVNGEYNIVTCKFPASPFSMTIYPELSSSSSFNSVDNVLYDFSTTQSYNFMIAPSSQNYLWLGNLPDDTELNIYLDIAYFDPESTSPRPERPWDLQVGSTLGRFYYYDSDHKALTDYTNYDVSAGIFDTNGVTDTYLLIGSIFDNPEEDSPIVDESVYMRPFLFLHNCTFYDNTGGDSVTAEFHLTEYEVVIHINSLILGGEYGEVLADINSKLAEQGKHINSITGAIERVPVSSPPKGYSDYLNSLRSEDSIFEYFSDTDSNPFYTFLYGMEGTLQQFESSLSAVSEVFNRILNIPSLSTIVSISSAVGLSGALLGIVGASINKAGKSSGDASKSYSHRKKG